MKVKKGFIVVMTTLLCGMFFAYCCDKRSLKIFTLVSHLFIQQGCNADKYIF